MSERTDRTRRQTSAAASMKRDPVCGMLIDIKDAAGMAEYRGKTYYFHTPECNASFEQNPEKYVEKNAEDANE